MHTVAAGCNNSQLVQPLVLAGVPADMRNSHHCTPLSFTPLCDNDEAAGLLLSRGANIDNTDKDGDTPLTEAIKLNAHKCLRLFMRSTAEFRLVNKRGWTFLHFAATYGDMETMEILVLAGLHGNQLRPHAADIEGNTPDGFVSEAEVNISQTWGQVWQAHGRGQ